MRKVLNYVNSNKKIIIVVVLIIILIGTIYFLNKANEKPTSTSTTTQKSATEVKLSSILSSIDGVGAADVMVTESGGGIVGVIIVCEGANNIMTKNNILNAVATALNIDKKIIAIYSMTV